MDKEWTKETLEPLSFFGASPLVLVFSIVRLSSLAETLSVDGPDHGSSRPRCRCGSCATPINTSSRFLCLLTGPQSGVAMDSHYYCRRRRLSPRLLAPQDPEAKNPEQRSPHVRRLGFRRRYRLVRHQVRDHGGA